jgi:hypothetical protein
MRAAGGRQAGIRVPPFTGLFNYDQLRDYMAQVSLRHGC